MKTNFFAIFIISLLTINLSAQEPAKPIFKERVFSARGSASIPVYILDDIKIQSINKIEINSIQKVSVQKPTEENIDSLVALYGNEARNGILFIYSKEFIAKEWFKDFAIQNKDIAKIIENPEFKYQDYRIYLNKELLKTEFFDGLDKKMKSLTVKNIRLKKSKTDNIKGVILIKTKPSA